MLELKVQSETPTPLFEALQFGVGSISGIACIWLFCFYIKTQKPRSVSLKLILALAISDFFYSMASVICFLGARSPMVCYIEGVLREGSALFSFSWAACIAILA